MRFTPAVLLIACGATGLHAQQAATATTPRDVQRRQLEWQRVTLLAMADSMPVALYRDQVTPAQRDFAEQIHHAASTIGYVCSRYFDDPPGAMADTATVLNSVAGLKNYVNAVYDHALATLNGTPDAARAEVVNLFGMMEIPRSEVWDQIYLHTVWTAGQMVANFRKHGMAPPEFVFF